MLVLALALFPIAPLPGQRLRVLELSAGGLATLAAADFTGGGAGLGWRPSGLMRIAVAAFPGRVEDRAAVRGELTLQLLLTPAARRGGGLYAGAGLTWQGAQADPGGTGYLTVLVGIESAPGQRWGWYGEGGLAGGVRLAAGVRRRWFPAWW